MQYMFFSASAFNHDLSQWDTSRITEMMYMFVLTTDFNQNISKWDTSSVTDMNHMFANSASFNQNVAQWDISNVIDMSSMFTMLCLLIKISPLGRKAFHMTRQHTFSQSQVVHTKILPQTPQVHFVLVVINPCLNDFMANLSLLLVPLIMFLH